MNVFPYNVTGPDGTLYQTCRIISDGVETKVWHWPAGASSPAVVLTSTEVKVTGKDPSSNKDNLDLVGPDGVWTAVDGKSCGCSHPLKHWAPARPVRSYQTTQRPPRVAGA